MRCEHAREELAHARYAGGPSPELDAHLAECGACRALHARHGALDRWLAVDEPAQAGAGFDTRFFAALAQERERARARARRRRTWRIAFWALPAAVTAAAAALLFWERAGTGPSELPPEELALAVDLELVEEIEVVAKLEELEAYEVLSQIDEDELDRILQEEEAPP